MIPPNEPDYKLFTHEGIRCLAIRHKTMGHWCGYVQVPNGHPLKEVLSKKGKRKRLSFMPNRWGSAPRYDKKRVRELAVHGGVTFSGKLRFYLGRRGVWLGFDCAHHTDIVPALSLQLQELGSTYKDLTFVETQCRVLARQLKEIKS